MKTIDLRSDTVTLPTSEMIQSIMNASLGDDVYGEDATVNKLQDLAADKMGKEKALLVSSGTQGNLVSILSHCRRGDEVIMEATSHSYRAEAGGIAIVGGIMPNPIPGEGGILDPGDVEKAIRPKNVHYPPTSLITIENTHNSAGGTCWKPYQIKEIKEVADRHGIRLHMDGARVFNAAVALNVDVKELTRHVDSVMFCLSKGLSAPVGSLVVGDEEFIERAHKWRKVLGGGMRQAGVIAAPGIVALEKMVKRLKVDHENARMLAEGLSRIKGISINLETVQTNIVRYDIAGMGINSMKFISRLNEYGVKSGGHDTRIRMVTHRMIGQEDIKQAINCVKEIAENCQSTDY